MKMMRISTLLLINSLLFFFIQSSTKPTGNSRFPRWYKLYSQLNSPIPSIEPFMIMEPSYISPPLLTNITETRELSVQDVLSLTSGFDMREVPLNKTFIFNSQTYVENIIKMASNAEQDQMTRIVMYDQMKSLLCMLLSESVSVTTKIKQIKQFPGMETITGDSLSPDIYAGELLKDWNFKIEDDS